MNEAFPIKNLPLPKLLREIPDPPNSLHIRGVFPPESMRFLAVVGSRAYTPYGKRICENILSGLSGYPVVIVSGLALGIDGIAHNVALKAKLKTVAVPGSGLDDSVLYPATHRRLAQEILTNGGALISEFDNYWKPRPESFPQRNRIMAGISHAVLVVEAEARSGTLITSRLATEYNRDVYAIPGPIDSPTSQGPHMLLQKGAGLVTSASDILTFLGIDAQTEKQLPEITLTADEEAVREILRNGSLTRDELLRTLSIETSRANVLLSSLELRGLITEQLGTISWKYTHRHS